jgi:2-keto-4-pentenoate hydratase/2-oxohepta-3-ene-1,7-dioic acid hydratase in catechol pathway
MKLCRFDEGRRGVVADGKVYDITALAGDALLPEVPADLAGLACRPLAEVRLLAPVRAPGKIFAAPVNYKAHIEEMKRSNASPGHNLWDIEKAGLFLKASSSLVGPAEGIAQRFLDRRTDFEVELAVVIGRRATGVRRAEALSYVAGYCLGIDVTVRGTEDRSFRKSVDSYSVLGPWLTTADEVPDPQAVRLSIRQNGEMRQDTSTADMLWDVARLIEFATGFYTLHPGDVLYTGTPSGVGPIRPGDRLHAMSDRLGEMHVAVREYKPE